MNGYKGRVAKRKRAAETARFFDPPSKHVCDETCEHYRTPLEKALREKIVALLKVELPPGTRAVIEGSYFDVRVVCGGSVPDMVYYCCLKPKHEGKCYSSNKQVYFTPEPPTYS